MAPLRPRDVAFRPASPYSAHLVDHASDERQRVGAQELHLVRDAEERAQYLKFNVERVEFGERRRRATCVVRFHDQTERHECARFDLLPENEPLRFGEAVYSKEEPLRDVEHLGLDDEI